MRFFFPLLLAAASCSTLTVGNPCTLVRASADGGTTPLLVRDVPPGRDYLSRGATECDEGLCVRDADWTSDAGALPTDPARGYCSAVCSSPGRGCLSVDQKLTCRQFVLDGQSDAGWPPMCVR